MEQKQYEKKRRRRLPGWAKLAVTAALTFALTVGAFCLVMGRSGMSLVEGWILARHAFVDRTVDFDAAADRALSALVEGLGDRWSCYLDPEWNRYAAESRTNSYVGVGVTVSYEREEGLLVRSVTPGGPAEQAGITTGDLIVAVDGVSVAGEMRDSAAGLIRGEEGSQVVLTLMRAGDVTEDVTCTRARFTTPPATGEMLEGQIGYVRLNNFYLGSAHSFRVAVEELLEQGAQGLVIDLRDNPGGYVDELKLILDFLLPEGPVFTQDSRWWFPSVYKSDADCVEVPMVAIVNGETYSAAELLAAQLRESVNAPIVGEPTCGKGYSQITFPMPNGGGFNLSTATYATGSGHSLIGGGLTPDVELSLTPGGDDQLEAAVALLTK